MDADIRSSQPQAVQATRRFSLALLLAVAFAFAAAGCAGSPVYLLTGSDPNRPPVPSRQPTPITTVTSNLPTVGCYTNFALGLLSVDPQYGTRIADGTIGGGSGPVMWPVGYTARKSGSEVEVLDKRSRGEDARWEKERERLQAALRGPGIRPATPC